MHAAGVDDGRPAPVDERPHVRGPAARRDDNEVGVERGDGGAAFLCALEPGAIDERTRGSRHARGDRVVGAGVLEDAAGTGLVQRLRALAERERRPRRGTERLGRGRQA